MHTRATFAALVPAALLALALTACAQPGTDPDNATPTTNPAAAPAASPDPAATDMVLLSAGDRNTWKASKVGDAFATELEGGGYLPCAYRSNKAIVVFTQHTDPARCNEAPPTGGSPRIMRNVAGAGTFGGKVWVEFAAGAVCSPKAEGEIPLSQITSTFSNLRLDPQVPVPGWDCTYQTVGTAPKRT